MTHTHDDVKNKTSSHPKRSFLITILKYEACIRTIISVVEITQHLQLESVQLKFILKPI